MELLFPKLFVTIFGLGVPIWEVWKLLKPTVEGPWTKTSPYMGDMWWKCHDLHNSSPSSFMVASWAP